MSKISDSHESVYLTFFSFRFIYEFVINNVLEYIRNRQRIKRLGKPLSQMSKNRQRIFQITDKFIFVLKKLLKRMSNLVKNIRIRILFVCLLSSL